MGVNIIPIHIDIWDRSTVFLLYGYSRIKTRRFENSSPLQKVERSLVERFVELVLYNYYSI